MKHLNEFPYDGRRLQTELGSFRRLLASNRNLQERTTIKPFFEKSRQLSGFIGSYIFDPSPVNYLAYEFEIAGDFRADIIVGNRQARKYCLVELEEGLPGSILARRGRKSTKEWTRRFSQGFNQLVDWFYALDDMRSSDKFTRHFDHKDAKFHGLLVIGRSSGLTEDDERRLFWRENHLKVAGDSIRCVTYDKLYEDLNRRFKDIQQMAASCRKAQ